MFSSSPAMLAKYLCECGSAAGMCAGNWNVAAPCFPDSVFHHLMRNCVGEQNHQVGTPQLLFKTTSFFDENFCFASMIFTDVLILTHHTFISTDNHDFHVYLL